MSLGRISICQPYLLVFIGLLYPGITENLLTMSLKISGIQPRFPVRKRTPRVPVSCLDTHSNEKPRVPITKLNENRIPLGDSVSKEAWKTPNSPLGSHTAYKKLGDSKTSHVTREDAVS